MALFFDYPQTNARDFSASEDSARSAASDHGAWRVPRTAMPHHICVRLVGGWLAALIALLALVLMIRWYG